MKVNVLGTDYEVFTADLNNPEFSDCDGKCFIFDKRIGIRCREYIAGNTKDGNEQRLNDVIRHELVHAFAQESGVCYDDDEALTDWIARMIPKIEKSFGEIKRGMSFEAKDHRVYN